MVVVAQLVRASVCGTEGRRFETDLPPIIKERDSRNWIPFFYHRLLVLKLKQSKVNSKFSSILLKLCVVTVYLST